MSLTSEQARKIRKQRKSYDLTSVQAQAMAAMRTNPGRPRSNKPRCPCGAMTLKRAQTRGHHC